MNRLDVLTSEEEDHIWKRINREQPSWDGKGSDWMNYLRRLGVSGNTNITPTDENKFILDALLMRELVTKNGNDYALTEKGSGLARLFASVSWGTASRRNDHPARVTTMSNPNLALHEQNSGRLIVGRMGKIPRAKGAE